MEESCGSKLNKTPSISVKRIKLEKIESKSEPFIPEIATVCYKSSQPKTSISTESKCGITDNRNDKPKKSKVAKVINKDVCAICLSSFTTQSVGIPSVCSHQFCLECILEWSKNTNSCPIDRKPFTIIKSYKLGDLAKVVREIQVEDRLQRNDEDYGFPQLDYTFCEICGESNREDRMLLCDRCDKGYHCECLNPPLEFIPIEDWFCQNCAPPPQQNIRNTAVRPSTSTSLQNRKTVKIIRRKKRKTKKLSRKRPKTRRYNSIRLKSLTIKSTFKTSSSSRNILSSIERKYSKITRGLGGVIRSIKSESGIKSEPGIKREPVIKNEPFSILKRTIVRRKRRRRRRRTKRGGKFKRRTKKAFAKPSGVKAKILNNISKATNSISNAIQNSNTSKNESYGFNVNELRGGRMSPLLFIDMHESKPLELTNKSIVNNKPPVQTSNSLDILNSIMSSQSLLFTDSSKIKVENNGSICKLENKDSNMKTNLTSSNSSVTIKPKLFKTSSSPLTSSECNKIKLSANSKKTPLLYNDIKKSTKNLKIEQATDITVDNNKEIKKESLFSGSNRSIVEKNNRVKLEKTESVQQSSSLPSKSINSIQLNFIKKEPIVPVTNNLKLKNSESRVLKFNDIQSKSVNCLNLNLIKKEPTVTMASDLKLNNSESRFTESNDVQLKSVNCLIKNEQKISINSSNIQLSEEISSQLSKNVSTEDKINKEHAKIKIKKEKIEGCEKTKTQEINDKAKIEELDKIAKSILKPYFMAGRINKEEYKELMKKLVKSFYKSYDPQKDSSDVTIKIQKMIEQTLLK